MKIQLLAFVGDCPVYVEFGYTAKDPYAIEMVVLTGQRRPWAIGRDLLRDGLIWERGKGDVRIVPNETRVEIHLSTPTGSAMLEFRRDDLAEVLRSTTVMVPFGREIVDWSAAARRIPGVDLSLVVAEDGAS